MDVEIDHRHALGAVGGAGVKRRNGDAVEHANPIARDGSAWWPGGRTAQKALSASPAMTRSTAEMQAPVARRAASQLPGETTVSTSSHLWSRAGMEARIIST